MHCSATHLAILFHCRRVKQRAALEEGLAMQHEGQQKKVERLAKMGDPAYNYNVGIF